MVSLAHLLNGFNFICDLEGKLIDVGGGEWNLAMSLILLTSPLVQYIPRTIRRLLKCIMGGQSTCKIYDYDDRNDYY